MEGFWAVGSHGIPTISRSKKLWAFNLTGSSSTLFPRRGSDSGGSKDANSRDFFGMSKWTEKTSVESVGSDVFFLISCEVGWNTTDSLLSLLTKLHEKAS